MKILQYHISNFECYKIIQHHIENFVWYNGDPQYFFHKKYVLILWHLILRLRLSRPSRTMPMISPMPLWSSPCKSCLIDKYPPLLECDGTLMFSGTNFFLLPIPVPTKKKRIPGNSFIPVQNSQEIFLYLIPVQKNSGTTGTFFWDQIFSGIRFGTFFRNQIFSRPWQIFILNHE